MSGIRFAPYAVLATFLVSMTAVPAYSQTRLFACAWHDEQLLEIDPATGASSVIGSFSHRFVGKPVWDSTNGVLYAVSGDAQRDDGDLDGDADVDLQDLATLLTVFGTDC
jgi:hypothetical protein